MLYLFSVHKGHGSLDDTTMRAPRVGDPARPGVVHVAYVELRPSADGEASEATLTLSLQSAEKDAYSIDDIKSVREWEQYLDDVFEIDGIELPLPHARISHSGLSTKIRWTDRRLQDVRSSGGQRFQLKMKLGTGSTPDLALSSTPRDLTVHYYNDGTQRLSANQARVALRWIKPAYDGNVNDTNDTNDTNYITGYEVRWSDSVNPTLRTTRVSAGSPLMTWASGPFLTGRTYSFSVVAINGAGESQPTPVVLAVPHRDPPRLIDVIVGGSTLYLIYDEAIDQTSQPPVSAFTVAVNGEPPPAVTPSSVSEPECGDLPADGSTRGLLVPGDTATGHLVDLADADRFATVLEEGKTYTVDLDAPVGSSLEYVVIRVRGPDGNVVAASAEEKKSRAKVWFEAQSGGGHYVEVDNWGITDSVARGDYEVGIYEDVVPDLLDQAMDIAVGAPYAGEIQFDGDADVFAVQLVSGTTYRMEVKGAGSGEGTLADPGIVVVAPSGSVVFEASTPNQGEGNDERFEFAAEATGEYLLSVFDDANPDELGTYVLSVVVVP